MICPKCGAETEATTGRCGACQTDLSDASTQLGDVGPTVTAGNLDLARTVSDAETRADADAPTADTPTFDDAVTASDDDVGAVDDSPVLAPGQRFGPRYQIMRLVGEGGMGAVYEAFDNELGVDVALKVIRPEQMGDGKKAAALERRFKRELLLGRKVTHKNVVRIHDIGEIGGIKYITMPYIDGRDLSSVLKEAGGTLPVSRTLKIARSVLSGLTAAHDAGVVHRDMKPANIMIDADDEAYIMDFGIALAVTDTTAATDQGGTQDARPTTRESALLDSRTQLGRVVGTVQYMAPEQGRGETVDKRADLYAFGLILYDMLVGRQERERTSSSPLEELTGRMKAPPAPVRTIREDVPAPLAEIIGKCVAPDPAERYPHPHALQVDLDLLDGDGALRPVERRFSPLQLAALVSAVVAVMAGGFFVFGPREPPPPPDPVSLVIADFENHTNDAAFDGTLEPMLKRVLDDAGFITAYDRSVVSRLGVPRPERLDDVAARELAVQQGLGVVLSGAVNPRNGGYTVSMDATETITGEVIASVEDSARGKDDILDVATGLIARVRNAPGDDTSESQQQFAMAAISATSLDVVGLYAATMEAASAGRFDEARQRATEAVELDPNFGVGYLTLAVAAGNLGRADEERQYLDEALAHLDGMTERERYATRAYAYWATSDYEQCVQENTDLITLYPLDIGGRNQLALCLSHLREMRRATEEVQAIVDILPSHPVFRTNLAIYANYGGDFQLAEQAARDVEAEEPNAYGALTLAFAQMGQGQVDEARETYERLAEIDALGASFAASGLGDLAAFEGRFSDAASILRQGAADDLAAGNTVGAAGKLAAVAHAGLSRGRIAEAIEAADEALTHSSAVKIRFLSARTFVEAGDVERARPIIDALAGELYAEPRAYAGVLEGVVALQNGDAPAAMSALREANDVFDTWIGYFDLGRASLAAGAFPQATTASTCRTSSRIDASPVRNRRCQPGSCP